MQKTSLCLTIKNEEDSIVQLLRSIDAQNKLPDEVIIVDGGSTDDTLNIIKKFKEKCKYKIRLIKLPNSTRSQGRNKAISMSKYGVIALTDAGCVLDKQWLEKITLPIIKGIADVVPGNYRVNTDKMSNFSVVATALTIHTPSSIYEDYLASSRSLAITKNAWVKSGGYLDELNTAEDLVFVAKLKSCKLKHTNAPDALVNWSPPKKFSKLLKTFFMYAYGDGLAGMDSPHAFRYGMKLFLLGIVFFVSAFRYKFILISVILLLLWWLYQAAKLKINSDLLKRIPIITVLIVVICLFWVTLIGYVSGLIYSKLNMRK